MKFNFLYLFATLLIMSCSSERDSFVIEGELKGLESDLYYADIFNSKPRHLDTIEVVNGVFEYNASLLENDDFRFLIPGDNPKKFIKIFVDNSDLKIKGDIDSIDKSNVQGSIQHNLFDKLMNDYSEINQKSEDIALEVQMAMMEEDSIAALSLEDEFYSNEAKKPQLFIDFANNNTDKNISAWALYQIVMYSDFITLDSIYKKFTPEVQSSKFAQDLKYIIDEMGKSSIGAKAPDFTLPNIDNKEVSLKDYQGKNVLLLFWSPLCIYCKEEMPLINELYNKYKSQNIEFIGINVDEDKNIDIWELTVSEDKMLFPQLFDSIGVADKYKISNTPFNFFIDKEGVIFSKDVHGDDLEKEIIRLLNQN